MVQTDTECRSGIRRPLIGEGADDAADHRADCCRAEGDARAAFVVLDVMHHMMPRRRGRMMVVPRSGRTMMNRRGTASTMGSGQRGSGQGQAGEKNHNDFSSLVHITPSLSV